MNNVRFEELEKIIKMSPCDRAEAAELFAAYSSELRDLEVEKDRALKDTESLTGNIKTNTMISIRRQFSSARNQIINKMRKLYM
jgi:hypothetical protein